MIIYSDIDNNTNRYNRVNILIDIVLTGMIIGKALYIWIFSLLAGVNNSNSLHNSIRSKHLHKDILVTKRPAIAMCIII